MPLRPRPFSSRRVPALLSAALLAAALAACGSGSGTSPGASAQAGASQSPSEATPAPRPSSTAVIRIVNPTQGETVPAGILHVVISLTGARIVAATTTNIRPDEGHLHLYVDNTLVSMNYGLTDDLPVKPGTYELRVEFVASDHAPFDPRVVTPDIVFTVR